MEGILPSGSIVTGFLDEGHVLSQLSMTSRSSSRTNGIEFLEAVLESDQVVPFPLRRTRRFIGQSLDVP